MSTYIPIHCHSDASLLDAISTPDDIVERIKSLGLTACAITDHGVITNTVKFYKKCKDAKIKAILGCELYISEQDASIKTPENKMSHLVVLAKNHQGWKDLIKIVSASNKPEHFYRKPRLSIEQLGKLNSGNLVAFSGHPGSLLANALFTDLKAAYRCKDAASLHKLILPDWKTHVANLARQYESIFGKGNFFIEIQLFDKENLFAAQMIADALREISTITGIPCVATPDAHYPEAKDAIDQRISLCKNMHISMKDAMKNVDNDEDFGLSGFFKSDRYYIPSPEDMVSCGHTEEELANSVKIADMCEVYNILSKPMFPPFPCPDGKTPPEYLRELCIKGWKERIENNIPKEEHKIYGERIKEELGVIQRATLDTYFLIVSDILQFIINKGWLAGVGRGSAAGCLVSYILNIVQVDAIKHKLLFSRFYNESRNTADRVKLPDIDIDVPASKRDEIIQYIIHKYGEANVSQMVTFQNMKGRSAIKNVCRAYNDIGNDEMNRLCKFIPDEASISDELQEMKQENDGESSIIKWALENNKEDLAEWCTLEDDGSLSGPLAERFKQAIRLEGVKAAMSKHAAGLAVSPIPLEEVCPMVYDTKTKKQIAGFEMGDLEDLGIVKLDILGISLLDKIMGVQQMLEYGEIFDELTV